MTEPRSKRRERLTAASGSGWQEALDDADPAVRRAALLAGTRLAPSDRQVGHIEVALGDADPTVRREAAEAAGRRPETAAKLEGPLSAMLTRDDDVHCREAAAFALGESGDPGAADAILASLDVEVSPLVREAAVAALGALGRSDTLAVVVAMTTGEKPAVRRRAVVALAAFDDPEADAAIVAASTDRDRYVREVADWLLRDGP